MLPSDYTFTAAHAGTHTFQVALEAAGTQSVTVADALTSDLMATAGGIVVSPTAAALVLTAPARVTHGVTFGVTLAVQGAYGNVVTGYTGTVHPRVPTARRPGRPTARSRRQTPACMPSPTCWSCECDVRRPLPSLAW
jgi:hypothetical protein